MTNNKKTRSENGAGKEENKITTETNTTSGNHYIIKAALLRGESNAIPAPMLARLVGMQTTRQLRKAIESARLRGDIILSSDKGYFLPADGEAGRRETNACYREFMARAAASWKIANAISKPLRIIDGQISLADNDI